MRRILRVLRLIGTLVVVLYVAFNTYMISEMWPYVAAIKNQGVAGNPVVNTVFDPSLSGLAAHGYKAVCAGATDVLCAEEAAQQVPTRLAWVPLLLWDPASPRSDTPSLTETSIQPYYLAISVYEPKMAVQLVGLKHLVSQSGNRSHGADTVMLMLKSRPSRPSEWDVQPRGAFEKLYAMFVVDGQTYAHCGSVGRGPSVTCLRWVNSQDGVSSYHELLASQSLLVTDTTRASSADPETVSFDTLKDILRLVRYTSPT